MQQIFRIFEYQSGNIEEIAFVRGKQSALLYLTICKKYNTTDDVFYFAQKITIEQ